MDSGPGEAPRADGRVDQAVSDEPRQMWHVISSDDMLRLLRRVAAGEDPEMVYLEEYVNAEREDVSPE